MTTTLTPLEAWNVRPSEPFREHLTPDQWNTAYKTGVLRSYSHNTVISPQGSTDASTVAFVYSGWVKASCHTPRGTAALNLLYGQGDLIGAEALAGGTRNETTTALLPARLLILNVADFLRIIADTPRLVWALHRHELGRRVIAERRRAAMACSTGSERLALTLIGLVRAFAHHPGGSYKNVTIPLTQDELSELAGTHRNTTVNALKRFRRAGALETGRGNVTILSIQQLLPYTRQTTDEPLL